MKGLIQLFLVLVSLSVATSITAQNKSITVTGKVISFEESLGLEGVSINVKGSSYYSGTHADGTFSLSVDSPEKTLVFSLRGYQTTELKLNDNSRDYEVVLKRGSDNDVLSLQIKTGGKIFFVVMKRKELPVGV